MDQDPVSFKTSIIGNGLNRSGVVRPVLSRSDIPHGLINDGRQSKIPKHEVVTTEQRPESYPQLGIVYRQLCSWPLLDTDSVFSQRPSVTAS